MQHDAEGVPLRSASHTPPQRQAQRMGNLLRAILLLWPLLTAALVITEAAGWTALGNWVFAQLLAVGLSEAGAALLTLVVVIGFGVVPCVVAIIWGIIALIAGRLGVAGGLDLQSWEARKVGLGLLLATPAVGAVVLLFQLVVV